MIDRLQKKIFWIIMIPISIIFLGSIIILSISNYNNIIESSTFMLDRFTNMRNSLYIENEPFHYEVDIEGLYRITYSKDQLIVESENYPSQDIINLFEKAIKSKKDKGIIGGYIYKVRKAKPNEEILHYVFMKNEMVLNQLHNIKVFTFIISFILLIIAYILSKEVSKMFVKPINEMFEKQKQFISDASHELKTPLAVIKANSDVLETKLEKDNKWIGYIQNEIDSMNKLINELLLLAKLENIDEIKKNEELNLSEEIKIIYSMFESMAYDKGVYLENNIEDNIKIIFNKEDIEHILSTLIDNAICHTEKNNNIIIELLKEKSNIVILVKNKGDEIPKEEREKIFERFYRIDKSRNRKSKRYGLGLAICKTIVSKYHGNIDVDYIDGYTIFKVTIPNLHNK